MTIPDSKVPDSNVKPAQGGPPPCLDVLRLATAEIRRQLTEKSKNGTVSLDDANRILDEFSNGKGAFSLLVALIPAKCTTPRNRVNARKNSFRRLMVRPFEPLLEGAPPEFPRDYLPHFFKVVEAVGGDWRAKSENACRTVLQSLLLQHGHDLTWEQFYADTRTHHILTHSLRHLLTYLETPAGQWLWEQAMLRQTRNGLAPTKTQAERVRTALMDTWRALEAEITKTEHS